MPNPLANGDRIRARVVCKAGTQCSFTILYYVCGNLVGTAPDDTDAAPALEAWLEQEFKDCMSAQAEFRGLDIRRVLPTATAPVQSIVHQGAGSIGGDMLPRQTCGLISKSTGLGGRANRGRVYVPFPPESANTTAGSPDSTYMTPLNALATVLEGTVTVTGAGGTIDLVPVVYHDSTGLGTAITACFARQKWATQRRRGDYGRSEDTPF